jgi:organic radical activating enzyme
MSCHRSSSSGIPENFDDFHNTSVKVHDRSVMLQGKWPGNGCEYCRNIEDSGGVSDRQFQNLIPEVYPRELDDDRTLTSVTPAILEVFFSNTCNLACVYCSAKFSSSIQAENKKFGGSILPELNFEYSDNRSKELIPEFWKWFEKHSSSLQRLQILGGEPFLLKEVMQLIDYFDEQPHPNLEFNLVTNLSMPTSVLEPILEKLKVLKHSNKLKRIDIQVSVDCWEKPQEYIRYGFNLETFERNMLLLIEKNVFRIGLLSTFTSLSIPTLTNLAVKYNQWCKQQKIFWYMHLVLPNNKSIFDPTVFEYSYYEHHIDKMYSLLPNETWDDNELLKSFSGIVSKLKANCKYNADGQTALVKYLNENDTRRQSNWKIIFPDLNKIIEGNHVV